MLTWIKKRVRMYEQFAFAQENDWEPIPSRRAFLEIALEDWQWMTSNATGMEEA